MHDTSFENLELFFKTYLANRNNIKVIDVGSNVSSAKINEWKKIIGEADYIGVDVVNGHNVDVLLKNPYVYPFEDESIDVVIANSIFEHSEFFWELFLELVRILKPNGLLYINAPSNGDFHRGPFEEGALVDAYRFYPDSGKALQKWANHKGFNELILLESYIFKKRSQNWNDFVAIFLKNKNFVTEFKDKIIKNTEHFYNGYTHERLAIYNHQVLTEDHANLSKKDFLRRLYKKIIDI